MKVLFLTNIPSPYRVEFFNEMTNYCDLTVVFDQKSSVDRDAKWISGEKIKFESIFLDGLRIKEKLIYSSELVRISKMRWDIIVLGVYMSPSAIYMNHYCKKKNVAFYIEADGGFIKNDSLFMGSIKRKLISNASGWISSGIQTNKYLEYYGAKKKRIFVFPFSSVHNYDLVSSFEEVESNRKESRDYLGMSSDRKVVISVGRFIYLKGFDILIKSASSIDADIYIIGGTPTNEYLDLCKITKANNVHFVEFKTKADLKLYYQAADIFAFPTREDVWGLVINEALSVGLPIVATNKCIAAQELISNGENGFIVESNNSNELADKINCVLNDDDLRKKMIYNNIQKSKKYTIEEMASVHRNIFEELLRGTHNE